MGTYTKIKPAGLTKLNNAEYTNFMKSFHQLAFAAGGSGDTDNPEEIALLANDHPLGISDAQKAAFEKDLALMTDLVNQSRVSDETALLLDLDKRRDDLVVYLTTSVSQTRKSPIEAQREAARKVYNIIKPCIGIYKSANQQETAQIQGLLIDLGKEGIPALIQTLGLNEVLDSLRTTNDEYARLTAQRTGNKAASIKEASASVRLRMDNLYDDMTTIAFVQSVAAPTAETARFVNELNALINETTALYNQRVGIVKAAAQKKEKPEPSPGEEVENPEEI